jgi:hypothetical protein
VGHLLISWDSLGQWNFRLAQNDRYRHSSLSEIRRKNRHSVPVRRRIRENADLRMNGRPDQPQLPSRESGSWLCGS